MDHVIKSKSNNKVLHQPRALVMIGLFPFQHFHSSLQGIRIAQ